MTYITSHHITPNTTGVCIQSLSWTFIAMKFSLFILILSCFNGIFGSGVYSQRPYFHWIKSNLNCPKFSKDGIRHYFRFEAEWSEEQRQLNTTAVTSESSDAKEWRDLGRQVQKTTVRWTVKKTVRRTVRRTAAIFLFLLQSRESSHWGQIKRWGLKLNLIDSTFYSDNLGNLRFQHIDQNLKVPLVPGDTKVMTSIRVMK